MYVAEPNYYVYIDYPIKGDIDHSRKVENSDLVLLARYIVGIEEFSGMQVYNADIDNDNEVTNTDLILLAKMIVSVE